MKQINNQVISTRDMSEKRSIKYIALANGDLYEDILFSGSKEDFITKLTERGLINITVGKTEILINPDFIVSIVF